MDDATRREVLRILRNLALAFAQPLNERDCSRAIRRAALAFAALFADPEHPDPQK